MDSSEGLMAVDRRALLRNAALLLGGSMVSLPATAFAQSASAPAKRFFTAAQFSALDEVAEIIIPKTDTPGARQAGVPATIDAMMTSWASPERREQFRALLNEFNAAAQAQGAASLRALSANKRFELVQRLDAEKLGPNRDPVYARFKELVMTTYYLSEPGATQELRYELVPGAWEPWTKIDADTRAWAV